MGIGVSLFLLAVGAILAFAVNATVNGVDISTVGIILMIVGGLGLLAVPAAALGDDSLRRTVVVEPGASDVRRPARDGRLTPTQAVLRGGSGMKLLVRAT